MPSEASSVGPLALPLAAGATDERIDDPAASALLDMLAFITKDTLDARLGQHQVPGNDAVPTLNRFSFDPFDPRGHSARFPVPSLFCWWPEGTSSSIDLTRSTTIHNVRKRTLHAAYLFEEHPARAQMDLRGGQLLNAVDAAWHRISERQTHATYSFDTGPNDRTLARALGAYGDFDWEYVGGAVRRFGVDDADTSVRGRGKASGRDFPALLGVFNVWEKILPRTQDDPADVAQDILLTINASDGEQDDYMEFMQRILLKPDGSENLDEE